MKTLLTIIFSCIAFIVISQDTTYTLRQSEYEYIGTDNSKAWTYEFTTDTIDASSNDDTLVIILPQKFGTALFGLIEVTVDTITLEDILVGDFEVKQSQCLAGCPVSGEGGSIPANTITVGGADFYVKQTRMWLEVISTAGIGVLHFWITLKPSSIPAE